MKAILTLLLCAVICVIAYFFILPWIGMQPTNPARIDLDFTCTQEEAHYPPIDPQADLWFRQARWLEKQRPVDWARIGELYRLAAEKNHPKALRNLQLSIAEGKVAPLAGKTLRAEVIDIVEKMMQLHIPSGYFAMGYYLERGFGVKPDQYAALTYYRRSADFGSPEGQFLIGKILDKKIESDRKLNPLYHPEIAEAMLVCSAEQGYADAAHSLALNNKLFYKNYPEAVKYYHLAVKNGNNLAAYQLYKSFLVPSSEMQDRDYLGLEKDEERSRRYYLMVNEIDRYPYARFPDIDQIVPLPPAELPEWDGTFEYRKELNAGMPSE